MFINYFLDKVTKSLIPGKVSNFSTSVKSNQDTSLTFSSPDFGVPLIISAS